jgi:hypothetical protein
MMNDFRSSLRRIASCAAVVLATLAMTGCAKKITAVDPSYTSPEGRTEASAKLISYPDLPVSVALFKSKRANCEECVDSLISISPVYPSGPGVINGMIFDGTPASSYEILRRESNGGYAPLYDYALNPSQRFAQSGWKLFTWQDGRPSSFDPPTYLGRGIVSGVATRTTPLTNVSLGQAGDLENISLTAERTPLGIPGWTHVPSAAGYILQIYSLKSGYPEALLHNAAPAPFADQDHLDYFVAWLPANQGTIDYSKAEILTALAPIPGSLYLMHISAVDALGRMVGFSYGNGFEITGPGEGFFRVFWGGAFLLAVNAGDAGAPMTARFSAAVDPISLRAREPALSQVKVRFGGRKPGL